MDIVTRIASNLSAWMEGDPSLKTIKAVSKKSGVGFGTIRRAKNGDGNITVKNLALIAQAFRRPVEDLFGLRYDGERVVNLLTAREPEATPPLIMELITVAQGMTEVGQAELLGRAKEMALRHAQSKRNRVN